MQALTQTHKSVTNETGFYSLVDLLTNREHATPLNLPPIKKTSASQIVDKAITDHLALIPQPEYETVHCPEGGHDVLVGKPQSFTKSQLLKIIEPLAQAMRELAPMFPDDERVNWMNRVRALSSICKRFLTAIKPSSRTHSFKSLREA